MKHVTIPAPFLQELVALCGPEDHELRERVLKSAAPAHPAEGVPAQAAQQGVQPKYVLEDDGHTGYLDGQVSRFSIRRTGGEFLAWIVADPHIDDGEAIAREIIHALNAADPTTQGLDVPWTPVKERLPERAMEEVLILQMFIEEDGTPRNVCRGEFDMPVMRNIAKAHCHIKSDGTPDWRSNCELDFGIIKKKGWQVVAWRPMPETESFCQMYAAQAKQGEQA